MTGTEFHGAFPYLVSPVTASGEIMDDILSRLFDDLIAAGVHGPTPLVSTGEFAYITWPQRKRVAEITVKAARYRPQRSPMEGLTMHDLAADVASVIEHEHAGPVIAVGHAFGNFVARQLATDRPDLVRGVVLAAASAGKVPPGSTEKPIGPEMRKLIDGPPDPSLPEKKRLESLKTAFFAPGNDPTV